jgi:hypothetical protein
MALPYFVGLLKESTIVLSCHLEPRHKAFLGYWFKNRRNVEERRAADARSPVLRVRTVVRTIQRPRTIARTPVCVNRAKLSWFTHDHTHTRAFDRADFT